MVSEAVAAVRSLFTLKAAAVAQESRMSAERASVIALSITTAWRLRRSLSAADTASASKFRKTIGSLKQLPERRNMPCCRRSRRRRALVRIKISTRRLRLPILLVQQRSSSSSMAIAIEGLLLMILQPSSLRLRRRVALSGLNLPSARSWLLSSNRGWALSGDGSRDRIAASAPCTTRKGKAAVPSPS